MNTLSSKIGLLLLAVLAIAGCGTSATVVSSCGGPTIQQAQQELAKGKAMVNLLSLGEGESVATCVPVKVMDLDMTEHIKAFDALQEGVRGRREGLHRREAPARGRHGLLRRRDPDHRARGLDDGPDRIDRGRAVLRKENRLR